MLTHSGVEVFPRGEGVPTLHDIGWNLAQMPRFAGSTSRPWSVFQHLMLVAGLSEWMVVKQRGTRRVMIDAAINAWLHDAHEAILGDIPSTWKTQERKDQEHNLDLRIYNLVGAKWMLEDPTLVLILSQADHWALQIEGRLWGPPGIEAFIGYDDATISEDMLKIARMTMESTADLPIKYRAQSYEHEVMRLVKLSTGPDLDKVVG